jgi:hypothetical protein
VQPGARRHQGQRDSLTATAYLGEALEIVYYVLNGNVIRQASHYHGARPRVRGVEGGGVGGDGRAGVPVEHGGVEGWALRHGRDGWGEGGGGGGRLEVLRQLRHLHRAHRAVAAGRRQL